MTLAEFERQVFAGAMASPICGIPIVRHLTSVSIGLRLDVTTGGFIDAFYNERTGTMAFALIQQDKRVLGADNTGGWHVHPLDDPERHDTLPTAMSFDEFVAQVERITAHRD